MHEIRYTHTNAADDSGGQAFGLEGNLYLPVVIAATMGIALFAALSVTTSLSAIVSGTAATLPVLSVLGWAVWLRQGKPRGHDRDWLALQLVGQHFTRITDEQRRVA